MMFRRKRGRLHYQAFNMVEIALALAILCVGISSVIVLFPVGVNANRDTVAENNLADVAEYVFGSIQGGIADEWKENGGYESKLTIATSYKEISEDDKNSKPLLDDFTISSKGARFIPHPNKNGVWLFRQLTLQSGDEEDDNKSSNEYTTDFAAIVKVWEETPDPLYLQDISTGDMSNNVVKVNEIQTLFSRVICMEISWPADFAYADREKAYYRLELFNDQFDMFSFFRNQPSE